MPRTGGVYSPPAGTKGTPNTTIQSVPYNTLIDDLTADANAPRPVTAGGTGATSASGARDALGTNNADNLTSGTVADARLPSTMAGKTFSTSCTFQQGLNVTGGVLNVQLASATTEREYITLKPTDAAGGKPWFFLKKEANATTWGMGLWDGASTAGTLTLAAGTVGVLGNFTTSGNGTFTGNLTSQGAVTGVGGLYALNGDIVNRGSGNKHVWFQTPAGVVRGLVYHDNAGSMNINTYNTSGAFLFNQFWGENGVAHWGGHIWRAGGGNSSVEFQMYTNAANHSYRLIGDSGGGLYIQRSNDRFVANAPTLLWWNSNNDATFAVDVYARRFWSGANGDGQGIKLGDDAWIGDIHQGNTMSVRGGQDAGSGFIRFGYGTASLGVFSSAADRLYYGNSFYMQTDGNMYIPYAGLMLHQMFDNKAGIYFGGTRDELNFPLGHHVLLQTSAGGDRNSTVTVYLFNTGQYQLNVSGSPLTGTWRTRGAFAGSGFLMQRVG